MSLSSILDYNNKQFKEFRTLLKDLFPNPKFRTTESIKVHPVTDSYALIGTAFDYLLRFTLQKKYAELVHDRNWVSEGALRHFAPDRVHLVDKSILEMDDNSLVTLLRAKDALNSQIVLKFQDCKNIHQSYVNSTLKNEDEMITACLFLARLDAVIRKGESMIQYIDLTSEKETDITDLKLLLHSCNLNQFKPQRKIVLNPTFGKGSSLVGGADADLIIDDTLIDIKVTLGIRLTRPLLNQLIGYYLLFLIGKVAGHEDIDIKKLGIYFARHGVLWTIGVNQLGDKKSFEKAKQTLIQKIKGKSNKKRKPN